MYTVDDLTNGILQLTQEERHTLFELLHEHHELFGKILPGLPLLEVVAGREQGDPAHPLIENMNQWKNQ